MKSSGLLQEKAQYRLAQCYLEGSGTDQDEAAAFKWFEKAAKKPFRPAQYNLGRLYASGRGTVRDFIKAYGWMYVAASAGYEPATQALNKITDRLNPHELTEAVQLGERLNLEYGTK